jgi:hypothetical protein
VLVLQFNPTPCICWIIGRYLGDWLEIPLFCAGFSRRGGTGGILRRALCVTPSDFFAELFTLCRLQILNELFSHVQDNAVDVVRVHKDIPIVIHFDNVRFIYVMRSNPAI